jgi:N-acylglucosamine-6-phosphate 2-epimerase
MIGIYVNIFSTKGYRKVLKPGVIVSCQAPEGSFLDTYVLCQIARSVLGAEPAGLRLGINVARALLDAKADVPVPIIGLVKEYVNGLVHITPAYEHAKACEAAGCEYVATDGTGRWGYDEMKRMLDKEVKVVADVATAEQGLKCEKIGCYAITTALSGYTLLPLAQEFDPPDLDLVAKLNKICTIPIIAEGRYRSRAHIKTALANGASNICMGAAITRPDLITKVVMRIFDEE